MQDWERRLYDLAVTPLSGRLEVDRNPRANAPGASPSKKGGGPGA